MKQQKKPVVRQASFVVSTHSFIVFIFIIFFKKRNMAPQNTFLYNVTTMELLGKLFGGTDKVKIMRFFLHNSDDVVNVNKIAEKTKCKSAIVRKELSNLASVGFIEKKKSKVYVVSSKTKKGAQQTKEIVGFKLNNNFPYNDSLRDLLFDFEAIDKKELANRFKHIGRIKKFIVAGLFIGDEKSRVDILIVGEAINKTKAEKVFDLLSSETGRDLVFSVMDVEEFDYRYKMYDKFIRDILEMPNEIVIDKLTKQF